MPSPNGTRTEPSGRVLVVDDESSITDLLSTALRYMGYEVTTARTGMSALEQASRTPPDVVVLDVMLPDIDGFEVCRRLRADGDFVPVIFLTARDQEDDRVTGFIRGGDDYVTKPFSLEELTLRIGALLRRTKAADAGQRDAAAQVPRPGARRGSPPGLACGRRKFAFRRLSSGCCATCCSTRSGCFPSSRYSITCGSTTSTATTTWSRRTSAICVASWTLTTIH